MSVAHFKKLFYLLKLNANKIFISKNFRNFHNVLPKLNYKNIAFLEVECYEDLRLQKHLNMLKDQYLNLQNKPVSSRIEYNYQKEMLKTVTSLVQDVDNLKSELNELCDFIKELESKDNELLNIALQEKGKLEGDLIVLKQKVLHFLIPDEIVDEKDIIMELSPGVGGQEAMLFTKDMFEMYYRYAQWKNWSFDIIKYDTTDIGGLRNAHIAISGQKAFKILKYECGVHRIQRVPKTERSGRIHTSTMTVAVLPQPSEIDIVIQPRDIELEFKRSSGAGGQHVNTTDSCVRIKHKATGIVAESQMERCQHRNRELALKSLRAKLYERELQSSLHETISSRKLQIGTAGRSEKVRTYNYTQDRITDHRAHINTFDIEAFFKGEGNLDDLLNKLQEWSCVQSLNEILNKYDSK